MKTELNWEVAPHWATCAAMDGDGTWYFYRHTPKWDESAGVLSLIHISEPTRPY